jgi:uncharacterized protein (UPF0218 family)
MARIAIHSLILVSVHSDHSHESVAVMPVLTFDEWKRKFRENCEAQGKLLEFSCLGDYVLQKLWESGIEPSVQALLGRSGRPTSVTRNPPSQFKG